ncbi:uncharacterized protein LOC117106864 [Anneissia japonica]|uniref:uncharacterized protein LOC117106864 n=1 Tax=Anneissia japonica TaxID=1529436 RepID=UPI0014255AF4|nr:uncharacterized protein LOC117106864 [Anneissia japonica]
MLFIKGTDWAEEIPIHAIQYCASDFKYPRAFTFVARARQGYLCHIFYTKDAEVAEAITVSFARAFKRAYEDFEDRRSVHHQQQRRARDSSSDDERNRDRNRRSRKSREYRERYDYDTQPAHNIYGFDPTNHREPRPMLAGGPPRSTRYIMYDDYPEDDRASTIDPIFSRRQGPSGERLKRYDFVEDEFQMPRHMNGFSDDMIPRRSTRSSSRRKEHYPLDDMEMPSRRSVYENRRSHRYNDPYGRDMSY